MTTNEQLLNAALESSGLSSETLTNYKIIKESKIITLYKSSTEDIYHSYMLVYDAMSATWVIDILFESKDIDDVINHLMDLI